MGKGVIYGRTIKDTLVSNSNAKLIVSYERVLTEQMLAYFAFDEVDEWGHAKEHYSLYKMNVADDRDVYMLATPFFGNGRISYGGLEVAARRVMKQV